MAVLLVEREAGLQLWREDGGGPTLDDLLSGAWEGLAAASPTSCPVCDGELVPRWSAAAAATAAAS